MGVLTAIITPFCVASTAASGVQKFFNGDLFKGSTPPPPSKCTSSAINGIYAVLGTIAFIVVGAVVFYLWLKIKRVRQGDEALALEGSAQEEARLERLEEQKNA
jgi:H+/Cl- antiporter ClcA